MICIQISKENKESLDFLFPLHLTYNQVIEWLIENMRVVPIQTASEKHDKTMILFETGKLPEHEGKCLTNARLSEPSKTETPILDLLGRRLPEIRRKVRVLSEPRARIKVVPKKKVVPERKTAKVIL